MSSLFEKCAYCGNKTSGFVFCSGSCRLAASPSSEYEGKESIANHPTPAPGAGSTCINQPDPIVDFLEITVSLPAEHLMPASEASENNQRELAQYENLFDIQRGKRRQSWRFGEVTGGLIPAGLLAQFFMGYFMWLYVLYLRKCINTLEENHGNSSQGIWQPICLSTANLVMLPLLLGWIIMRKFRYNTRNPMYQGTYLTCLPERCTANTVKLVDVIW